MGGVILSGDLLLLSKKNNLNKIYLYVKDLFNGKFCGVII